MKIGIFGGTFDPPHKGHIQAVAGAAKALGLDRLLLIPDKIPPHKALQASSATAEDRLEMTKLAAKNLENCTVSDMELRREGRSYTVDTLRILKEQYPRDELIFIMGSDMLMSFHTWREPKEILSLARIAAFPRMADDEMTHCGNTEAIRAYFGDRLTLMNIEPVEISSTRVRQLIPVGAGVEYLEGEVYDYILKKGLYRTAPATETLQQLRDFSYPCHKAKRVPHVQGCEKEAVKLCERWGGDENTVRRAAILHDITKALTYKEQLKMCERYDILTDSSEIGEEKLLHSITGAYVAEKVLRESENVVSCVRWHTTGKPDMNIEEKIVFMADYIEENRKFPGVDALRELAYKDLDAAIIYGLELTMDEIKERGRQVHGNSLAAYRFLKGNVQ
ncbi:MAG: nicotinate-nucleotide adenylyltransferase [Oscillospiraceae bacterium]|nr:nicotinate-nucleotide adenylyltransferase [Oscillospiraceae bacterium]